MSFAPIVQRELAVAARGRRMFGLRMLVAAGSTASALVTVFGWDLRGGGRTGGSGLFGFLSGLFWLVCLGSGIFLTADCLSREKREGTIGLLFLTDLKGHDIILGKLVSTSLTTVLMLIGAMPVLAICLLLGGVTGGELFRVCVSLLLTMLFSLSVGMFVSTFVRESRQAGSITFLFLLLATVGMPVLAGLAGLFFNRTRLSFDFLSLISPAYLDRVARSPLGPGAPFFQSVILIFFTSLALLAVASVYLPYTWQDRPQRQTTGFKSGDHPATMARAAEGRKRHPLLDQNPIFWLAGDHQWEGWLGAIMAVILLAAGRIWYPQQTEMVLPFLLSYVVPYLIALSIASQATQFFVRMRQQGALEFLLSTPLTDREILRGQWMALRRRYLPVAIVLVVIILLPFLSYGGGSSFFSGRMIFPSEAGARFYLVLKSVLLWFAAGWTGIYFGLNARRTQFAGLQAMACGVLLPWLFSCLPEVFLLAVVILVCQANLDGKIRKSIVAKLEAGQPI